jgi:hypothetical protein
MTNERTTEGHPADLELAAWVDEPEVAAVEVSAHIEACARCRDRVAELVETRAAIALDPPMPPGAAFAAQRERILGAIEESPGEDGGRVVGRVAWLVPLAAVAAVAAIVLIGRTNEPPTGGEPVREAIVAEAEAAAEEAAAVAADVQALDAALEAGEPLTPAAPVERSAAIEAEFALLSDAEQAAVLRELERIDFDL